MAGRCAKQKIYIIYNKNSIQICFIGACFHVMALALVFYSTHISLHEIALQPHKIEMPRIRANMSGNHQQLLRALGIGRFSKDTDVQISFNSFLSQFKAIAKATGTAPICQRAPWRLRRLHPFNLTSHVIIPSNRRHFRNLKCR